MVFDPFLQRDNIHVVNTYQANDAFKSLLDDSKRVSKLELCFIYNSKVKFGKCCKREFSESVMTSYKTQTVIAITAQLIV